MTSTIRIAASRGPVIFQAFEASEGLGLPSTKIRQPFTTRNSQTTTSKNMRTVSFERQPFKWKNVATAKRNR